MAIQRNFESLSLLCKNEKTENVELKKQMSKLKEENTILTHNNNVSSERIKDLLMRVAELEREAAQSRDEKKASGKGKEELMSLRLRIDDLEKIIERKNAEISKLEFNLKDLGKLSEKSRGDLTSIEAEKKIIAKELTDLKLNYSMSQQENKKLNSLNADYKTKISSLEEALARLQREAAETLEKGSGARQENEKLNNENRKLSAQIAELQQKIKKMEEAAENHGRLLQRTLTQDEIARKERSALQKDLETRDNEIQLLKARVGKLEPKAMKYDEHSSLLKKFEDMSAAKVSQKVELYYAQDFDELQRKIVSLQGLLDVAANEGRSKSKDADATMGTLRETIKGLEKEKADLKEVIVGKDSQLIKVNKELGDLKAEDAELKKKLTKSDEELASLKEKMKDLQQKLQAKSDDEARGRSTYETMTEEIKRLKSQIDSQLQNYNKLSDKNNSLSQLEKEYADLKKTLYARQDELTLQSEAANNLRNEKRTLENEISRLTAEIRKLQENESTQNDVSRRKQKEIDDLKSKMQEMTAKMQEMQRVLTDLNPDLVRKRMKELEDREAALRSVIAKFELAESSTEAALTCNFCMEIMKESVTCIPCGHSYCFKCKEAYANKRCHECRENNSIEVVYKNKLLDELISKHKYRQEMFEAVRKGR
eukprot:TRINITY_DN3229_c0_g1_i4.p1 TRINITY_DN3229_c0_g1~~TRINITY_DN3229_c0_g1_i4.p1  ORF type:complete len:655 (+),score=200.62 TRINITY_DN3229_c0_g1_i4:96-2060(+)